MYGSRPALSSNRKLPKSVTDSFLLRGSIPITPEAVAQCRIEETMFLPTPKRAVASPDRERGTFIFVVGINGVVGFLQPSVAKRECLVA